MTREVEVFGAVFVLLSILVFTIYFGLSSSFLNFDIRNEAAGKITFLENGGDLQAAIDSAASNDALFLRAGTYTTNSTTGYKITNKKLRILGSGANYTSINVGANSDYAFNITNSEVSFESVKISGAKKDGVLIDSGSNSKLTIARSTISSNAGSGINSAANLEIKSSIIDQNGDGIISTGATNIENTVIKGSAKNGINFASTTSAASTLKNVLINNNTGTGVSISGTSKVNIKNITVASNGNGIVESVDTPITTILNTIVQGSTAEGISLKNSNSTVKFSNSFQNTSNYTPATLGSAEGNLTVNSGFVAANEFQISSTSSVKDKGVTGETDADGSRIDMGAFGGAAALVGANSVPKITSTPNEYIKPGQAYNYEIIANDPDGDALSFIVLNNNIPRWLRQNNNKFTGTPNTSDIGYYGVMVLVSDRKGGNVVHPISINVLPEGREVPTPTQAPTATPTNTVPTPTPSQNVTPKITITSPKANTVFSKETNEIAWTLNQGAKVDTYEIKYSTDGQNFTTITTLPGTVTSYKWSGVESITSGKYFVRIEAKDTSTPPVTVGVTSEQFEVKNAPTQTVDTISITKNSPDDNDVVSSKRQTIVVEYKPEGVELDREKTFLKVNGQNVTYELTRNTIFYQPTSDFTDSRIAVEVELVTINGGKDSKQWGFNIAGTTTPQDTTPDVTNEQTILGLPRNIGLGILAVLVIILLLLILYFIVRFIRTIRDQRQGNLEAEFTEYYDSTVYPNPQDNKNLQPETDVNQPQVAQTAQNDMSQYYSDNADNQNQPSIQEFNSQNDPSQQDQSNQVVDQNQMPIDQNTQNVIDQSQVDQNQMAYQDPNQAQMDQGQQIPQDQGFTDQNQGQYSQQIDPNQPQVQNDNPNNQGYIEDLKKKYGVTDESINQYNQQNAQDPNNPQNPQNRTS
jgi:Right handed beta helix region